MQKACSITSDLAFVELSVDHYWSFTIKFSRLGYASLNLNRKVDIAFLEEFIIES